MNLKEVITLLDDLLNKEVSDGRLRNIVFWYDADKEFVDDIKSIEFNNSKVIVLNENNAFRIKYTLEEEDTESNYLVYAPIPNPVARENWLLDIQKYSQEFSTDKTTLLMRELGIRDESLRSTVKSCMKFFDNKERYKRFQSYEIDQYDDKGLKVSILSGICKLPMADFEQVVKTVLTGGVNEDENKYLVDISKFADIELFWSLVDEKYGYTDEQPVLRELALMLMMTSIEYSVDAKVPSSWSRLLSVRKADVVVFVDHFMNHSSDSRFYDELANELESAIDFEALLSKWHVEDYVHSDIFKVFDERIIRILIQNLNDNVGEFEKYRKIINRRRPTHWFKSLENEYNAIFNAMEMFRLERELDKKIKGTTAYELFDLYAKEYSLFDYFYRKFYLYYDQINDKDQFVDLQEKVENLYNHWFLEELSSKWSDKIETELQDDYRINGMMKQQDFYSRIVDGHVSKKEKVFVIISDALRYEVAKEFTDILNRDRKGKAELEYMQGVLPSYTKLGMASLLPSSKLEISKTGDVLLDGVNSNGVESRGKILSAHAKKSIAIQYNDVKDMKRQDYKDAFTGKEVVYIYHNAIDAVGDKAATERDVFAAVEKAIVELNQLVRNLISNVSATNIYITADHGFIYRRSNLQEFDKVSRADAQVIDSGRRFILSEEDIDEQGLMSLDMKYLLGKESNLKIVVPKGTSRFKIQGAGANFVHGGASLQEIVVPLVKFKYIRKEAYKSSKVDVDLTNISRKITNRITYLEFFQKEKVEDKKIPMTLKLYFVDEDNNRISNENIIIADSRSATPADRSFREKFTLKDQEYSKSANYYLVLEDDEETVEKEYARIPFQIDLAIVNNFGF